MNSCHHSFMLMSSLSLQVNLPVWNDFALPAHNHMTPRTNLSALNNRRETFEELTKIM